MLRRLRRDSVGGGTRGHARVMSLVNSPLSGLN